MSEHDLLRSSFLAGVLALFTPEFDAAHAVAAEPGSGGRESATPAEEAAELDAIIVTATRREQELRHVPMSVHVLDGDWLERRGSRGFLDWAYSVPGLSFSQQALAGSSPIAVIRGISDDISCCEINPLTALYFGETPVTQAGGGVINFNPAIELLDLDRIEVLRGPQGSYFGASAMGGAIRLLPRAPDPGGEELRFGGRVDGVNHGDVGAGAHAIWNQPFGERGAVRTVAYMRRAPGWIDDIGLGRDDVNETDIGGIRFATRVLPRDDLTVDFNLLGQRNEQDGFNAHDLGLPEYTQSRRVPESSDDRLGLASLGFDWQSSGLRVISTTSHFDRTHDVDGDISSFFADTFGLPGTLTVSNRVGQIETTQELRLLTPADKAVSGLLGVFWQQREHRFDQNFPSPGLVASWPDHAQYGIGDLLWRTRSTLDQIQRAAFADVSWRPTASIELSAGGRWFEIERDVVNAYLGPLITGNSVLRSKESGFAPRASVRYEVDDSLTIYANAARGFRPGSYNDPGGTSAPACQDELVALGYPDGIPLDYDFDSLWNYEIGARASWAGGRLLLNGALFHIDWQDIQSQQVLQCLGLVFVDNLGEARSRGAEIDLVAYPSEQLEFELALTYTESRFTDGAYSGVRLPGVPYLSMSTAATWHFQHPGSLRVEYAQVGDSYIGYDDDLADTIGDYGIWNLRYVHDFGRFQASFAVHNLTDDDGRLGVLDNILGKNETLLMPRTLSLTLEVPFH